MERFLATWEAGNVSTDYSGEPNIDEQPVWRTTIATRVKTLAHAVNATVVYHQAVYLRLIDDSARSRYKEIVVGIDGYLDKLTEPHSDYFAELQLLKLALGYMKR